MHDKTVIFFCCCFLRMWNLVCHIMVRTQTEGTGEQGAERNMWP